MQNRLVMTIFTTLAPLFTWLITFLIPGRRSGTLTQECRNKCRIMTLVQGLTSYMAPDGSTTLESIVEKCYAIGDFPALWAVEGAGKDLAEWHMKRSPTPTRMLIDVQLDPKWNKSLLMLHAGIGLGFARYWIEPLKPDCPKEELRKAVVETIRLCKVNSRPGYAGAAIESLGLVSRFIHNGPFCKRVHEVLTESEPDSVGYFWRGCGRSLYFGPKNFMPGFSKPCRAIDSSTEEAPNEECRQGLLSGIAWALTVVNMETPEVMEWVLANLDDYFGSNPGYASGVTSSVVMRWDTTPGFSLVTQFRNNKPADPKVAELWKKHVTAPMAFAIDVAHPVLEANSRLDEVFHFQSLPNLVASLGGTKVAQV
jgi:hypothetical protein